jgi:parallel beta-helix repeat protein
MIRTPRWLPAAAVAALALAGVAPATAGDEWVCPADPLTGEGLPLLDVRDFGAVGDGVADDRAALQSAINEANGLGGAVVFVPAGTYRLSAWLLMKSDVIIEGEGPESILQMSVDEHCLVYRGALKDKILNTAVRDLQIRGVGAKGSAGANISMQRYVENARIERCHLVDAGHDALHALRDVKKLCLLDNVVIGAGDDGLNPGGATGSLPAREVLIRGNVIDGVRHDGIHVSVASAYVTAVENTITNCENGFGLLSYNALIAANTITDCERGIALVSCNDITIQDNDIADCAVGIDNTHGSTPRMEVLGNRIERATTLAIGLHGEDARVEGNTITDGGDGIVLRALRGVVAANAVTGCAGDGVSAVGDTGDADMRVLDNTVTGAGGNGIVLDAVCAAALRNTVRESGGVSIRDVRGYTRAVLNDVDGAVESVPGDTTCDDAVSTADLLAILAVWGPCDDPVEECHEDVDGNAVIDVADLLAVLANFGL